LWTGQTFILYSMSLFGVHGIVKELLIDMNNKIRSYKSNVVNVRFHLNVFSTQVCVSPYIPKRGRDNFSVFSLHHLHAARLTSLAPFTLSVFHHHFSFHFTILTFHKHNRIASTSDLMYSRLHAAFTSGFTAHTHGFTPSEG